MVANGLAAVALLLTSWFAFAAASSGQRFSTAFLFLSLGLMHWLHAMVLASPSLAGPEAAEAARSLFSDWRIYVAEGLAALGAVVYLVASLNTAGRRRLERLALDDAMRRRHAVQLQDGVVQDLATAKMALERGDVEVAGTATAAALENAKRMLAAWLDDGVELALAGSDS